VDPFSYLPNIFGSLSPGLPPQGQPDADSIAAIRQKAAVALAQAMRQQTPTAPASGDGASFADRFAGDPANTVWPSSGNGVPLPLSRPNITAAPTDNSLDNLYLSAAKNQPQQAAPVAAPTSSSAPPSFGNRAIAALADFGAGGRAGGLFGALTGAVQGAATGQRFDPMGMQNQTVQALVSRGLPRDLAPMVASNPVALNQIVPRLLGMKQYQVTQTQDMYGNHGIVLVDPISGTATAPTYLNAQGQPQGGAPGAMNAGASAFPGVNPNLTGEAYLGQFPTEIQSAVKNYVAGNSMPTGNPRQGFTQAVKMIAAQYANDLGTVADDNTYAARHKAVTGLASTTPGSLGGQMTYARTSLNHLGDVADAAVNLNNSNGLGVAPLATLINKTRQLSTDQAARVGALNDAAGHYGQEITKYYAGSPGGEAERQQFQTSLGGSKSPAELAATLEQELNLATGKISKTQATIDEALGPNSKYQVAGPAEQRDIARVQAAIAKLRGTPQQQAGSTTPQSNVLAQARDAIARGANRTQVILRLQKMGVSAAGL
jgi:hypothetical protein